MIRISVPPSGLERRVTSFASIGWYLGGVHFRLAGRFTHSWMPWNNPPFMMSCSGGISSWRIPAPAVIHWVAPSVIRPPLPVVSRCSNAPSTM